MFVRTWWRDSSANLHGKLLKLTAPFEKSVIFRLFFIVTTICISACFFLTHFL